MEMSEEDKKLGWWTMSGRAFLDALYRVRDGEDPDMVYIEMYTNSDIEKPEDADG